MSSLSFNSSCIFYYVVILDPCLSVSFIQLSICESKIYNDLPRRFYPQFFAAVFFTETTGRQPKSMEGGVFCKAF